MHNALVSSRLKDAHALLPALIVGAGERAAWRFLEFFTVNIRNPNTRAAYGQAAGSFLRWCEGRSITRIEDVQPVHVAAYIEELGKVRSAPTVKQYLACIRMLFDWPGHGLKPGACRTRAAPLRHQRRNHCDVVGGYKRLPQDH